MKKLEIGRKSFDGRERFASRFVIYDDEQLKTRKEFTMALYRESNIFPRECKKGLIVEISMKGCRFQCNTWSYISVLPVVAEIVAEIILESIKEV